MLAQLIMLIVMCMQRHWLYAAMLAPSLLGSALMLITMIMRVRHEETNSNTITGSDSPVPTHHNGNEIDHAQLFADMPSISFEHLHGLDNDPLIWRTIVRNWLVRSPTNGIGMSEHGIFHIDLASSGPHAMVAGTTGSGKSELLISWCMALAIRHSPQTLHFVFLDFKGGSTFNAARLVVVIDEFHALRDRLPDYMQRLNRLASLGRSLGMHLIVCTQNPMGQVHADMKANISLSICLRVTDQMQSNELIGTKDAALIPPAFPGAAYCHDGQRTVPFRCSAVHDIDSLVHAINTASAFSGTTNPSPLFSAPLAPHAGKDDLTAPQREAWHHVPFALSDDGVLISTAFLDVGHGNIAVIGACGSGKTNLLLCCASRLYESGRCTIRFTRKTNSEWTTDDGRTSPQHERTIWFVDDADELLSPFAAMPEADKLKTALADPSVTVIAAVEKPQSTLLERCLTRVAFPCGERATDVMMGIPSAVLDGFGVDDYAIAGRGVFIQQARACPVQCAEFQGF